MIFDLPVPWTRVLETLELKHFYIKPSLENKLLPISPSTITFFKKNWQCSPLVSSTELIFQRSENSESIIHCHYSLDPQDMGPGRSWGWEGVARQLLLPCTFLLKNSIDIGGIYIDRGIFHEKAKGMQRFHLCESLLQWEVISYLWQSYP